MNTHTISEPHVRDDVSAHVDVSLSINGSETTATIDPRTTLLDFLRDQLGLTGTKKGCALGQCGACTVLVDDEPVLACLSLAVARNGSRVTTIEGLAEDGALHPVQEAFIAEDAFQCGYCTPGQIMCAVGLIRSGQASTVEDIREGMSGTLCRCGAYTNIVAAVRRAANEVET